MDYTEINKEYKRRMNSAIKGDAYRTERMDWEDPNLMIIMTGKYPRLRIPSYSTDKVDTSDIIEIQEAAVKMQKLVNNFVYFDTDITAFINKLKKYNAYDAAVESLQKLLDKRDAQRKDELWNAIIKSSKSYEEILRYVAEGSDTGEEVEG